MRELKFRTWGGGQGVFWQRGNQIGVQWTVMPDWGWSTPKSQIGMWTLGSAAIAERYFETMKKSQAWVRGT